MGILGFLFEIWLIIMIIGAVISIFTFVADVWRWHDREEKVVIVPSADDPEDIIEKGDEDHAADDREYNTSTVSFPWGEP